jgi:hypothetical protein
MRLYRPWRRWLAMWCYPVTEPAVRPRTKNLCRDTNPATGTIIIRTPSAVSSLPADPVGREDWSARLACRRADRAGDDLHRSRLSRDPFRYAPGRRQVRDHDQHTSEALAIRDLAAQADVQLRNVEPTERQGARLDLTPTGPVTHPSASLGLPLTTTGPNRVSLSALTWPLSSPSLGFGQLDRRRIGCVVELNHCRLNTNLDLGAHWGGLVERSGHCRGGHTRSHRHIAYRDRPFTFYPRNGLLSSKLLRSSVGLVRKSPDSRSHGTSGAQRAVWPVVEHPRHGRHG